MQKNNHHSVIIVGAGLSGLYAAWRLKQQKHDVILLEARNRTGGRILSPPLNDNADSRIDMGPAWIWPEFQPRLQQLLTKLEIKLFKQNTDGDILYEQDAKSIERYNDQSSHDQSYRIIGGANKLINTLQTDLAESSVHLNTQVISIEQSSLNIRAIHKEEQCIYSADRIILALPPRITQQSITFNPPLPDDIMQLWQNTPTWMAAHCKIVFIYDKPFWREQGLSGEVFSRHGPLSEIYDGSPANETGFALTSFVGLNAHQRKQIKPEQLTTMCMAQLQRLFGDESKNIKDIKIKDWALTDYTATETDLNNIRHHPQYPINLPRHFWDEQIILAGTEVAREHGGYLEGALESADEALSILFKHLPGCKSE